MQQERNSSIEILRILAMLGIVIMHTNGSVMEHSVGWNQIWTQIENGIFNAGVSVFVLISGYFGIRCSKKKLIDLEMSVIFYAVVSAVIGHFLNGESLLQILKAFIPVSTNCYWFMTCYILLMLFAPYLNYAIDSMNKKQFTRLLMSMVLVFVVAPTVLYYSVLGGGKNVINMLLLYFLGAYIKKYNYCNKFTNVLLIKIFCLTALANIVLNLFVSMLAGGKAHIPFARDCSAFIMIEATALLMLFLKHKFYSETVNKIAKHVFAVYLFEGAVRQAILNIAFDYSFYEGKWCWPIINIMIALVALILCMLIDVIVQRFLEFPRRSALVAVEYAEKKIDCMVERWRD